MAGHLFLSSSSTIDYENDNEDDWIMKPTPWESFLYQPPSWMEPLDWQKVFHPILSQLETQNSEPGTFPIHVDLGAGDGGFVTARAQSHPDIRFIAVERLLGRARKIAKKACRNQLDNVRALRIEASYVVEFLIPPHSIQAITILFPDPWPKRRHQDRRLIQSHFLVQCARCLRPDGWIAIKTDDAAYFEQIVEMLAACQGLEHWKDADPEQLIPELTDFERDFLKAGRSIHFLTARPISARRDASGGKWIEQSSSFSEEEKKQLRQFQSQQKSKGVSMAPGVNE